MGVDSYPYNSTLYFHCTRLEYLQPLHKVSLTLIHCKKLNSYQCIQHLEVEYLFRYHCIKIKNLIQEQHLYYTPCKTVVYSSDKLLCIWKYPVTLPHQYYRFQFPQPIILQLLSPKSIVFLFIFLDSTPWKMIVFSSLIQTAFTRCAKIPLCYIFISLPFLYD